MVAVLAELVRDERVSAAVALPSARPVENNRAQIAKKAIEQGFEWLLSIDSDNPPMRNVLDLVFSDLPLVGFPTPIFHWKGDRPGERPWYWNAYRRVRTDGPHWTYTEWPVHDGLQQVDAIGTGCFLVKVSVLALVVQRFPGGPMARRVGFDGVVKQGGDLAFSERVIDLGYPVHAHFDYRCHHFKEINLTSMIEGVTSLVQDEPTGGGGADGQR